MIIWSTSGWDRFTSLGTPTNYNGFRVLAALLHGTLVVGVSQSLRRWTEDATYFGREAITFGIGPHSSLVVKMPVGKSAMRLANCDSPTGMHFPAILSNYNGMTAYICRRFVRTSAFLVVIHLHSGASLGLKVAVWPFVAYLKWIKNKINEWSAAVSFSIKNKGVDDIRLPSLGCAIYRRNLTTSHGE